MLKRLVDGLPLGLSFAALLLAIFTYSSIEREPQRIVLQEAGQETELSQENQQSITVDAAQLAQQLRDLEELRKDARNATDSASTILSFIEGGFTLLGALIGLGAVVFGLSIQDVRTRLTKSIADADERFDTNEKKLEEVIANINRQVQDSIHQGEARIKSSVDQVATLAQGFETSIRATESTVAGLHEIVTTAVESAKADAENSFRVLSLLLLAEQQVRARNRTTAISTLEEAYQIDPDNQTTNYLLGYLYVGRKDFDLAVQHLQRALALSPGFAPALAALGLAQRRMGDVTSDDNMGRNQLWSQAEFNLTRALASDPGLIDADNESYFGTLGGLYRRQKRYEDALKAYESAVKITPNNSYPVTNLATLYKKLGHDEQSLETFKRAIEISEAILDDHPGDTWARLDLAQALLVIGNKKRAMEEYKDAVSRIRETIPLETALGGLEFLSDAPTPIAGIHEVTQLLQDGIQRLQTQASH